MLGFVGKEAAITTLTFEVHVIYECPECGSHWEAELWRGGGQWPVDLKKVHN